MLRDFDQIVDAAQFKIFAWVARPFELAMWRVREGYNPLHGRPTEYTLSGDEIKTIPRAGGSDGSAARVRCLTLLSSQAASPRQHIC